MNDSPEPSVRLLRIGCWILACLPLFYFVILCAMAADGRAGLGGGGDGAWFLWTRRLCAHIVEATVAPPTFWALLAVFAQPRRNQLFAQAVFLIGGCGILVIFWSYANDILSNGRL